MIKRARSCLKKRSLFEYFTKWLGNNIMNAKNVIYYCVDDPTLPYKGVRGKGRVKIYEDITHNIPIAEKIMVRYLGSLEHPMAISLMNSVRRGDSVIIEVSPRYYSTWDYSKK
jgi:hypothetical protein